MKHFSWPYSCLVCHTSCKTYPICANCMNSLPRIRERVCTICARPLSIGSRCGPCSAYPPAFDSTSALFRYEDPIPKWIRQLKFSGKYTHAHWLGKLMAEMIVENKLKPDCLLPVPLHWKRRFKRGFNQSLELAKIISKATEIPIDRKACYRKRATKPQAMLHPRERRKNVRDAFAICKPLNGKHIALIDDVITTGTTIETLSQLLKKHGGARIDVYAVARAIKL